MASFFAKKVAKHVMKESAENKFGTEDPYFEHVSAVDMNGNSTGKVTKRKRPVPPGLTNKEEKVLKKVTRRAYRLDNAISFCGIRIGWEAIIGIIPGLGDVFGTLMALMVYWTCTQIDLPASLRSRMMLNILLDFAVGLVPVFGDVADALFRANTKNAALLHNHLRQRGAARIAGGEKTSGSGQPLKEEPTMAAPRPAEPRSSHTHPQSPEYAAAAGPISPTPRANAPNTGTIRQSEKVKTSKDAGSRGWFGGFSRGSKGAEQGDLEGGEMSNLPPRR